MGLFKSISKFYKKVDKAVGGVLPGGTPSVFKQTKTVTKLPAKTQPTPTPTSSPKPLSTTSKSYGGGSSPEQTIKRLTSGGRGTYNPLEGTYIDPSGKGYSTATPPKDAIITIVPQVRRRSSGSRANVSNVYSQGVGDGYAPLSVVSEYERVRQGYASEKLGLGATGERFNVARQKLRTQKLRGRISALKEAELLGLTALSTIVNFGRDIADLPQTAYTLIRNPKVLAKLPKIIKSQGKQLGETLRVSPGEAFIQIGGEILLMKGTGKAINEISKLSKAKLTKLGKTYVGEADIGQTLKIPVKSGKTVNLKVVGKIPKETLVKQTKRAGKKVKVAISSQADTLLGALKSRSKVIRKPIPGEADFTKATKNLLKKFDKGTINKKELLRLDKAIKRQGAKGLLERSFFADPSGKIRPSRLGVIKEKKGSILDYFSEDITFKKQKPQILLFSDVKVQKLPKGLKNIAKKLRAGKTLTKAEGDKLLQFQLKKSGKFKPIGFLSGESEITLAPGEVIKRVKKVGTTLVNKKRVPIIEAKPYKPKGKIKGLIEDYQKGKLTKKEIQKLDRLLKKETGFNYGLSSSKKVKAKYVSVKKIGAGVLSKARSPLKKVSKYKVSKITTSKKGSSAKYQPRDSRGRFIKGSSPKRKSPGKKYKSPIRYPRSPGKSRGTSTGRSPPKYPPRYPPKTPPRTPSKILPPKLLKIRNSAMKKIKKGKKQAYLIVEKRAGKFHKLPTKPLSLKDAKDKLAYRLDNKISRTARLIPIKVKAVGKNPKNIQGYFNKYKKNLRNYKIVNGKRVTTPLTWIEKKGRGVISTRGEKKQLALNRLAKAKRSVRKTRTRLTKKRSIKKNKRGASAKTQLRDKNGRFIKKKKKR